MNFQASIRDPNKTPHQTLNCSRKQKDSMYVPTYQPAGMHTYLHTSSIHPTYFLACVPPLRTYLLTYMHACMHACIHTYVRIYRQTDRQTNIHDTCMQNIVTWIHHKFEVHALAAAPPFDTNPLNLCRYSLSHNVNTKPENPKP